MTPIEQGYVEQGYVLPADITWDQVAARRAEHDIGAIYVPVGSMPGVCAAWGVPIINGKFLKHP